jgi:hypothetical protein
VFITANYSPQFGTPLNGPAFHRWRRQLLDLFALVQTSLGAAAALAAYASDRTNLQPGPIPAGTRSHVSP